VKHYARKKGGGLGYVNCKQAEKLRTIKVEIWKQKGRKSEYNDREARFEQEVPEPRIV